MSTAAPLLTLVEQSMLVRLAGPVARYGMLETLRSFGRHRLKARPYCGHARRAHAELFADMASSTVPHLFGPQHVACVDQLTRNLDELRSAYT